MSPPPLLLVHGYASRGRAWERVIRELERQGVRDVRAPDLPGYGSRRAAGNGTPGELIDALAGDLGSESEPVALVGHSMGALVALAAAAAAPPRVASLGLIGLPVFAGAGAGYTYLASRGRVYAAALALYRRSHLLCLLARRSAVAWSGPAAAASGRHRRADLADLFHHEPASHRAHLEDLVFAGLVPGLAASVDRPVALLHGTADRSAPVAAVASMAAGNGWQLATAPGAGHQLILERPRLVAGWIRSQVLGLPA